MVTHNTQPRSAIISFFSKRKRMPSYRELATLLGFSSPNAAQRLVKKWTTEGFVEKDETGKIIPGSDWVTDMAEIATIPTSSPISLPFLGSIQAGFPTGAEEATETITIDDWLIGRKNNCFMLRVSGDSMIDAGIHPGDMVLIERGRSPKNGDIVVAEVDHDWTLKYYQNAKGRVTLFPANKAYPPIVAQQELRFAGVVTATIRKYN